MAKIGREDILRLFGSLGDHTIAEVLALDAELQDLELAALRLAQEDDAVSESRKAVSGLAARIYDIVSRDPLHLESDETLLGGRM